MKMSHADNLDIRNRLHRAEGHLSSVVRMVAEGRDALVIAQQMMAVIKALEQTKKLLILDHIDHHLDAVADLSSDDDRWKTKTLREIVKYL